jgi:hypothetical protein
MTDAQVVTISTAFLAAIIAVLFNNSRIGDLRDAVNQRFANVDKRFDEVNRHIDDKFNLLAERLQRMEDNIMRILGDGENRISRLEGKQ